MVLEYLKNQKGPVDSKLLDRLGWNESQLEDFQKRWEQARQLEAQDPQTRRELEEKLESLGLRPPEPERTRSLEEISDQQKGLQDSGNRTPAPIRFRDAFESFRRNLGKN
jgi:hypothetical protein